MTDKEILAELKKSYEYLRDIRENGCVDHCNGQMKTNVDKLDKMLDYIADIYYDFYNSIGDIRVKCLEENNNEEVYVSKFIDGGYEYRNYDLHEETHMTCEDVDYFWYNDENFIIN